MREVIAFGIEARRWTVVFHRKAEHWFFSLIAMGHFKHVSALAWIPELGQWWIYDVGFRRTRLRVLEDGQAAQTTIADIMRGNAGVTVDVREDGLPLMRLGLFCTTAVSHLLGLRGWALRPDALHRKLVAAGGMVHDEACPVAGARKRGSSPRGKASRFDPENGATSQCVARPRRLPPFPWPWKASSPSHR